MKTALRRQPTKILRKRRAESQRTLVVQVHPFDPPVRPDRLEDLPAELEVDLPDEVQERQLARAHDGGDDDERDPDLGVLVVGLLDRLDFGNLRAQTWAEMGSVFIASVGGKMDATPTWRIA